MPDEYSWPNLIKKDGDDLFDHYRHNRKATFSEKNPGGGWRAYAYDELVARDKASLDIFWLKDESLSESDNLPSPFPFFRVARAV